MNESKKMQDQLYEIQKGLIAWYTFQAKSEILYVGEEDDVLVDYLRCQAGKKEITVTVATLNDVLQTEFCEQHANGFDYIVSIEKPELSGDPVGLLAHLKGLLGNGGVLLLGMNNRLGSRYFCGDKDKYTETVFGNAYRKMEVSGEGRMYSGAEIRRLLKYAGFMRHRFYSVLPNLEYPTHIFAEDYYPNEDIANRFFPIYNSPETVFLREEELYRDLIDNEMFHAMANAYLIEAAVSESASFSDAVQITATLDRKPKDAFITIIRGNGTVIKKNMHPEGEKRFRYMAIYAEALKERGVKLVDFELSEQGLVMPYINAPTGQLALKNALMRNRDEFLRMMDAFREYILTSSEIEFEDVILGPIARYGYIDLLPLNSFYVDGEFLFFDQEFRIEHYPVNAILARMITTLYFGNENLNNFINKDELYRRYGLFENMETWLRMERDFLEPLRNESVLFSYNAKVRRNRDLTCRNLERMNFSADRYYTVFQEIFNGFEKRDIYVFGSGKYASCFLDWYGPILQISGILDNDENKWGKCLYGIGITSPDALDDLSPDTYKVIVCVKDYIPILRQLDEKGVKEYSVYNGRTVYPRSFGISRHKVDSKPSSTKRYHIGYISGTFDLFHQGHLNLLRSAKEMCDYLIVGVVSDEGVRKFKHLEPFVPFKERLEIVSACRYVDEAVEIPLEHRDIRSAYALYHFDCQFCGSDYYLDPVFMNDREWLRSIGSDLVVLPYTQSTSSTRIRDLIEDKLLGM